MEFKENDIVEQLNDCSGAIKGKRYVLKFYEQECGMVLFNHEIVNGKFIGRCKCQENWKKVGTYKEYIIKIK